METRVVPSAGNTATRERAARLYSAVVAVYGYRRAMTLYNDDSSPEALAARLFKDGAPLENHIETLIKDTRQAAAQLPRKIGLLHQAVAALHTLLVGRADDAGALPWTGLQVPSVNHLAQVLYETQRAHAMTGQEHLSSRSLPSWDEVWLEDRWRWERIAISVQGVLRSAGGWCEDRT